MFRTMLPIAALALALGAGAALSQTAQPQPGAEAPTTARTMQQNQRAVLYAAPPAQAASPRAEATPPKTQNWAQPVPAARPGRAVAMAAER